MLLRPWVLEELVVLVAMVLLVMLVVVVMVRWVESAVLRLLEAPVVLVMQEVLLDGITLLVQLKIHLQQEH
jgi:hypothetical protein